MTLSSPLSVPGPDRYHCVIVLYRTEIFWYCPGTVQVGHFRQSTRLKFVLYVRAKVYNLPDDIRDAINTRIAERFAREGIDIPFPQLEVRLKQ